MPTTEELAEEGTLHALNVEPESGSVQKRKVFLMPRAREWFETTLATLKSDGFVAGALAPDEQADNLFYEYAYEEVPDFDVEPHTMEPLASGVWELRTADLRFFGWFWKKGVFIVSAADTKKRCLDYNLYVGYREQAIRDSLRLPLDPPPFILGQLSHVL